MVIATYYTLFYMHSGTQRVRGGGLSPCWCGYCCCWCVGWLLLLLDRGLTIIIIAVVVFVVVVAGIVAILAHTREPVTFPPHRLRACVMSLWAVHHLSRNAFAQCAVHVLFIHVQYNRLHVACTICCVRACVRSESDLTHQ